ncbi:MAG: DUF362 domain-containing protein [Bacteroidales bacterium]|nr:DUF362 domain-containing protein [Bacteroidales bacterium]
MKLSRFVMSIALTAALSGCARDEGKSVVYFTRNLSAEGLIQVYEQVNGKIEGHVGVKLHTGEQNGPNIIPREWVKALLDKDLPDANIIETNTYYEGDRYTTEAHRQTLEVNGWTFRPVDILDEDGTALLPVNGGKWFKEMSVGKNLLNYDSMVALTHFKGHAMGGFGGSNKNIGIGCADGRIGKAWIHTAEGSDDMWSIAEEELMERMTESTKATIDHFGEHVTYVNVMRNMSVSCDCEGLEAEAVVTPDVGILSSTDILALDQACVDIIYAMHDEEHKHMVERIESRHGLRQLTYMKELGMGSSDYVIVDLDNGGKRISAKDAARACRKRSIYNYSTTGNNGREVSMSEFEGKVMLVVNTASKCGFTPQYDGLEALYQKYKDKGFVVLGFPCDQFGHQEPGTDEEIEEFCRLNHGVTFPLMAKSDVNGPKANPIFKWLWTMKPFAGFGDSERAKRMDAMLANADPEYASNPDIKWNFTKFLLNRNGQVVARFEPTVTPEQIAGSIEELL